MKKLLLILPMLLLAFTSKYTPDLNKYTQTVHCGEVLHKKVFDICYSFKKKEPSIVAYTLTKNNEERCDISRKGLHFKTDYNIPRRYRAYPSDYKHEGYDRGHNAPNGNFNYNRAIQKQTFLMSNISPQAKWLNREYWAKVEYFAHGLAIRYNKVEVITGSCGHIGYLKRDINIPKYWFKMIYVPSLNKTISFLAPNTNKGMKKAELSKYKSTPKEIFEKCFLNNSFKTIFLNSESFPHG